MIDEAAKLIWDYMHMHQELERADAVFVLGSHDMRIAEYGAQLVIDGWTPFLILSGSRGKLTKDWQETEAERFAEIARKMGVQEEMIIIENKPTNTGENIRFTKQLLEDKGFDLRNMIVVQKPYMERRTYATFKKQWPEMKFQIHSPDISFENYPNEEISKDEMINVMVGDLQRIKVLKLLSKEKVPVGIPDLLKNKNKAKASAELDTVTLYRSLETLADAKLVRRVDLRHGHSDYELVANGAHHHHLVCERCGITEDIDWCPDAAFEKKIIRRSKHFGKLTDHAVEFFGICNKCLKLTNKVTN